MPPTEDDIREMIALMDRYKAQVELLTNQLNLLQSTEAELNLASDFLEAYPEHDTGAETLVPVGAGILVPVRLGSTDSVVAGVGSGIHVDMSPADASERVDQRLQRIKEMIQQTLAGIEQIETSAQALSQQLEMAYHEFQAAQLKGP